MSHYADDMFPDVIPVPYSTNNPSGLSNQFCANKNDKNLRDHIIYADNFNRDVVRRISTHATDCLYLNLVCLSVFSCNHPQMIFLIE